MVGAPQPALAPAPTGPARCAAPGALA